MGQGLALAGLNCRNKLVRKAGFVVGAELENLEAVAEERTRRKMDAILESPSHPLYDELAQMGSTFSHRLIPPRHTTKRLVPVLCASSHQAPQPRTDPPHNNFYLIYASCVVRILFLFNDFIPITLLLLHLNFPTGINTSLYI